jgi:hypothetical protein
LDAEEGGPAAGDEEEPPSDVDRDQLPPPGDDDNKFPTELSVLMTFLCTVLANHADSTMIINTAQLPSLSAVTDLLANFVCLATPSAKSRPNGQTDYDEQMRFMLRGGMLQQADSANTMLNIRAAACLRAKVKCRYVQDNGGEGEGDEGEETEDELAARGRDKGRRLRKSGAPVTATKVVEFALDNDLLPYLHGQQEHTKAQLNNVRVCLRDERNSTSMPIVVRCDNIFILKKNLVTLATLLVQ